MARLVLLVTSPRVPAGQLTAPAWRLLADASVVLAAPGHAQVAALRAEGIAVTSVPAASAEALAVRLTAVAGSTDGVAVWLCGPDGDPDLTATLEGAAEVLVGSADVPGARVLDLVAVMDRLRSPGGCPWDAAQTHASLLPYLLEEAYETVEAVETGDRAALREELGDVLLQVAFHSRVASEDAADPWGIDDVATDIVDKLVARHPHVFGDGDAETAAEVEATWEALKRVEKGRTSAVDGVPLAQPALALAAKLIGRAEKAGLEMDVLAVPAVPVGSLDEELDDRVVGDALFAVVARARAAGVDAEAALRAAARRFAAQVRAQEVRREAR